MNRRAAQLINVYGSDAFVHGYGLKIADVCGDHLALVRPYRLRGLINGRLYTITYMAFASLVVGAFFISICEVIRPEPGSLVDLMDDIRIDNRNREAIRMYPSRCVLYGMPAADGDGRPLA